MGRSDLVRRAMSKKKHKVMEEERKNFIYGIVENGSSSSRMYKKWNYRRCSK